MAGRRRNLSPWAYWRLHLESVEAHDPLPGDPAEIAPWRARVRERLRACLGADPPSVPLDVEVTDRVVCDGYARERVVFDVEAAMSVPAYLLVPHARVGAPRGPAVLAVHGHGPGKEAICAPAGRGAYAHDLAERGFVVLAPDLRCFGERSDPPWDDEAKYECDWNLVAATMAGRSPLAQNLWDMRRALDVLAAHPLVDADRIGACGQSYGGTITLFLAALDERVRAAVVSGYLASWQAAHTVPWNMCGSQVLPAMLGELEHVDVAALIAPRPLLVESGTDDPIFPVGAARATITLLRRVYDALGAPDGALVHDVFEGGHRWNGAAAYDFLAHWLSSGERRLASPAVSSFEQRVADLGLELPGPFPPHDPLDAVVVHGGRARTSGQLPRDRQGVVVRGVLGADPAAGGLTVEQGAEAAAWCARNALSVLRAELGSLDRVERVLSVLGFVASAPGFDGQPAVIDGASRLLHDVFGVAGRHSRSAIGVAALPRGGAVEIEVEVALR